MGPGLKLVTTNSGTLGPGLQLDTTNSATLGPDPGLQLVTTNSRTLGPEPSQEILILLFLWYCMMEKTMGPGIFITYGPRKAVAEVSNHKEPIGKKCAALMRKSIDVRLTPVAVQVAWLSTDFDRHLISGLLVHRFSRFK